MRKIVIVCLGIFMLIQQDAFACWKKKKRKKQKTSAAQNKASNIVSDRILVVSFISIASGIDYKAVPGFEKSMQDFNAETSCKITYEIKNWGREGERDYCIRSTDTACLSKFATLAKESFKGNERILINENGKCRP